MNAAEFSRRTAARTTSYYYKYNYKNFEIEERVQYPLSL